jgi:hypothetical protein
MLLLRSVIMSLLVFLIALIASLFKEFRMFTIMLLSPSFLAILTKINLF